MSEQLMALAADLARMQAQAPSGISALVEARQPVIAVGIGRDIEAICCELFGPKGWTSNSSSLSWNDGRAWGITHKGVIIATICEDTEAGQPTDDLGNVVTQAELDEALAQECECARYFFGADVEPTQEQEHTGADVISADDIIQRLLALPNEIAKQEQLLVIAAAALIEKRRLMQEREDALLLGDTITGKNAETRAAQLREATKTDRLLVEHWEREAAWEKRGLTLLQNTFSSLKAVARLLERGE